MPQGSRAVLRRAGLLLAAAVLSWYAFRTLPLIHTPGDVCTSPLVFPGEMLLHRIDVVYSQSQQVNQRMPGLALFHALIDSHAPPESWRLLRVASGASILVLLLAIGSLCGGAARGVAAVALLLGLSAAFPENSATKFWHGPDNIEALYAILVLAAAAAAIWRERRPTVARSLVAGGVIGVSMLYRSTGGLLPVWFLVFDRLSRPAAERPSWKSTLAFCLGPYLFLAPWVAMNAAIGEGLVLFERGETNYLIASGALGIVERVPNWVTLAGPAAASGHFGDLARWAVVEILKHPLRYLLGCLGRFFYIFRMHPLLLSAAFLGFYRARRVRAVRALALVAGYYLFMHCLIAVALEYFQVLWPLLAALGAFAAGKVADAPAEKSLARSIGSAATVVFAAVLLSFAFWTESVVVRYQLSARDGRTTRRRLDDALAAWPGHPFLLIERGTLRLQSGDLPGAEEDLSAALPSVPKCRTLALETAWIGAHLGRPEAFKKILLDEAGPVSLDEEILAADGAVLIGRQDLARRQIEYALSTEDPNWKRSIEKNPAVAHPLCWPFLSRSRSWMSRQPAAERKALLDAVFAAVPACADMRSEEELFAAENKDVMPGGKGAARAPPPREDEKAKSTAPPAVRKAADPFDVDALYQRLGRTPAALDELGRLAAMPGGGAVLWTERARLAAALERRDVALDSLRKAESRSPSAGDRRQIALVYEDLKAYPAAVKILAALAKANPSDPGLWTDKGVCEFLSGATPAAIDDLTTALKIDARWLPAALTLAAIYDGQGRRADLDALCAKAFRNGGKSGQEALLRQLRQTCGPNPK